MPRPATLVITIKDAKASFSQMRLNLPDQDTQSIADSTTQALARAVEVDNLIIGQIVQIAIILDIDLPIGIKSAPDSFADVEEGGLFVFETLDGYRTATTIPTIDETKIISGTTAINLADADVQDFVTGVITEHIDSRGDNVTDIDAANSVFKKSRGGAG